jgi:two-component system, chemotaxis family, protein-glutamate methylesterase/glutaminase
MIRVLIVDDSALMRAFLTRVVRSQSDMDVVAVAADPLVAIEQIRLRSPDVITLDVEMPRMNGLDFLRKLMSVRPLPVVMISSLTRDGAQTTMRALELGAVDFVAKPQDIAQLDACAQDIAEKIRAASMARLPRGPQGPRRPMVAAPTVAPRRPPSPAHVSSDALIAIGASTGGVEALREVLSALPAAMPPIVVAQHMPPGYTETFAKRLDAGCELAVKEAQDGEPALPGMAYIAPGGRHLTVVRRAGGYAVRVSDDAPVNRHRPSVDTLFRAVASAARERAIAVMLTGMGSDGAQAMLDVSAAGGYTIAQDEASCVVFGMPRQAIALGAVREVLPLGRVARRLVELCAA